MTEPGTPLQPPPQQAPPWVEIALLYRRDDPRTERARAKLSRVFGKRNIGEFFIDFDISDGGRPPFRGLWNPVTGNAAYYSGVPEGELIGVMAHELCHALVHPDPGHEPVDRQSEAYKREDRIAHVVGDAVSTLLGFPGYSSAAEEHKYANWVPAGEMAADEIAEAAEIVERMEALIAEVTVWPYPGGDRHTCSEDCSDDIHVEPLLVDESDRERALRWVSILAAEPGLEIVDLERAINQPTPRATVWLLRYRRPSG